MKQVTQQRSVPVTGSYDVVVCGGGPAGWIAAVAAARSGAKTALIEQFGFVGGMATAGLVLPISVFTYNGKLVCGGIPWEFVQRMEALRGAQVESPWAMWPTTRKSISWWPSGCCWRQGWSCICTAPSPAACTGRGI